MSYQRLIGAALVILASACSSHGGAGSGGTGGAPGVGAIPVQGQTTATGGVTAAGGQIGSGGAMGSGGSTVTGQAGSGGSFGLGGSNSANGGVGLGGMGGTLGTAAMGGTGGVAGGGAAAMGGAGGAAAGGAAAPSAGCGKTSALTFASVPNEDAKAASGSGNGTGFGTGGYLTIQSGGQSRGFALRLPDNYDNNKPYWLIFGFHWNGGNSAQVDNGGTSMYDFSYFGLQKQSKNGAIFVAPDGLGGGWANTGGRDLTFVDDMVKLIEDNYCVDTTRLVSSGFSYGGGMTYELACARAKVFHAGVIYEGAQLSGCDGGNDPIALWQTVGLTDTTCPVSLATPIRDRFVKNNGCTAQNPPQPPQPPPYLSTGGHICTDYSGCSVGHPLRWCVHQSGHTPAAVDGNSTLYGPGSASWTPQDAWQWLTSF